MATMKPFEKNPSRDVPKKGGKEGSAKDRATDKKQMRSSPAKRKC